MAKSSTKQIRVGTLEELKRKGHLLTSGGGHDIVVFHHEGHIYAVDNRCPHMGFPLSQGSLKDGILTCHWHHARFDLTSGGTFDPWADDVRIFSTEIRDGEVWVDLTSRQDVITHQRTRLRDGLEQNISLVIAKAAIALLVHGEDPAEPFRIGLDFGVRYRRDGWGPGLTMLTCMMNLLSHLHESDKPQALYHGLSAVANDSDAEPPRFGMRPLPDAPVDLDQLKRWFRRFVEVRDAEGAERCLVSAVRAGARPTHLADMLFVAATDHRYLTIGHVFDFTNKALEALDSTGWSRKDLVEQVLGSLAPVYARADRMEESNSWRDPIDLIEILEGAFAQLPAAVEGGRSRRGRGSWRGQDGLVSMLLNDDPQGISDALLAALREGATEGELAGAVAYAAALRIARFPMSNEFTDWDTALHTFTFANAVHQGLKRAPSVELLRGVFDAAMSVYLDRFLNMPAARLPEHTEEGESASETVLEDLLMEFLDLLDQQQRVNEAGVLIARYLGSGGHPQKLLAMLGKAVLREDRDFHNIQMMEASFRQHEHGRGTEAGAHVLIAAARYLAAHAPTVRAQRQTYEIARRLHRGEKLYEEAS
jgi:nitrite reductase/ring-hydroxylating ferredoxin subunit